MNSRQLKNAYKWGLRKTFLTAQHLGFDILPRHFYSEIPDIRALRTDQSWKAPFSMIGVPGIALQTQLDFVRSCMSLEITAHLAGTDVYKAACDENGAVGFGRAEADLLFAFVASHRPAYIFQVGCGVSTSLCLAAARFAGYVPAITCVDPYPTRLLARLAAEGTISLLRVGAQNLDMSVIDALGDDGLFFVDSSHALGPAGEVSRIILEMLPRLKPGTRIHFHDILFPYDYTRKILTGEFFFPHESILLHGFLALNSRFAILASCSMLHYGTKPALQNLLPNYSPAPDEHGLAAGEGHFPSSIYIQAIH